MSVGDNWVYEHPAGCCEREETTYLASVCSKQTRSLQKRLNHECVRATNPRRSKCTGMS